MVRDLLGDLLCQGRLVPDQLRLQVIDGLLSKEGLEAEIELSFVLLSAFIDFLRGIKLGD